MNCYELVIYTIKSKKIEEFYSLHKCIIEQLSKIEGFISFTQEKSTTEFQFVDKVLWDSKENALLAYDAFKTFSCKDTFAECVEKVHFSGHFIQD